MNGLRAARDPPHPDHNFQDIHHVPHPRTAPGSAANPRRFSDHLRRTRPHLGRIRRPRGPVRRRSARTRRRCRRPRRAPGGQLRYLPRGDARDPLGRRGRQSGEYPVERGRDRLLTRRFRQPGADRRRHLRPGGTRAAPTLRRHRYGDPCRRWCRPGAQPRLRNSGNRTRSRCGCAPRGRRSRRHLLHRRHHRQAEGRASCSATRTCWSPRSALARQES